MSAPESSAMASELNEKLRRVTPHDHSRLATVYIRHDIKAALAAVEGDSAIQKMVNSIDRQDYPVPIAEFARQNAAIVALRLLEDFTYWLVTFQTSTNTINNAVAHGLSGAVSHCVSLARRYLIRQNLTSFDMYEARELLLAGSKLSEQLLAEMTEPSL